MSFPPAPLYWPPVVSILGNSDSGKTVLVERLVPRLRARGLRVAVVKHCSHGIDVDHPGKDSDRIFKSGADVLAVGPGESFLRLHAPDTAPSCWLRRVPETCDVLLIEGFRETAFPKIRLSGKNGPAETRNAGDAMLVLADAEQGCDAAEKAVWDVITRTHAAVPTYAAVLVGRQDAQVGSAPSSANFERRIGHVVAAAAPHVRQVVLVGPDSFPEGLPNVARLPVACEASGATASLLTAMRWQPGARWIVLSPDATFVSATTVQWLLGHARPGLDVILPALPGCPDGEPLLGVVEPMVRPLLEEAAARAAATLRQALSSGRVFSPTLPAAQAQP